MRGVDVGGIALPCLLGGRLERAAIREAHLPRVRPELIDRVQASRGLFIGLPARQEDDPRHGRGHGPPEAPDGCLGNLFVGHLLRRLVARQHHVRLEEQPLERASLFEQLVEHRLLRGLRHVEGAINGVIALHVHLGLHDRHDARFLAQRRVARERVR